METTGLMAGPLIVTMGEASTVPVLVIAMLPPADAPKVIGKVSGKVTPPDCGNETIRLKVGYS